MDGMKRVAVAVVLLALLGVAACGDDEPAPAVGVPAWAKVAPEQIAEAIVAAPETPAPPPWAKVAPEQIAEARKHGVPVAFENDLGMRFVLIPAGEAVWGVAADGDDIIRARVARPFYLQTTEVTAGQFRRCFPTLERIAPDSRTEDGASRERAVTFADWLTRRDGPRTYRLPSRDEWFYVLYADTRRWSCGDPIVEELSVDCRDHREWPSCFRLVSPLPESSK